MTIEITPEQIRAAALKVYEEVDEEFSYADVDPHWDKGGLCFYVLHKEGVNKPGCIVGRILAEAGVPVDVMERVDNMGSSSFLAELHEQGWWGHSPLAVLRGEDMSVTPSPAHERVERALAKAQSSQDNEMPWRQALRESGLVDA